MATPDDFLYSELVEEPHADQQTLSEYIDLLEGTDGSIIQILDTAVSSTPKSDTGFADLVSSPTLRQGSIQHAAQHLWEDDVAVYRRLTSMSLSSVHASELPPASPLCLNLFTS